MAVTPQLLVDTLSFKAQLLEAKVGEPGKLIARGEFARADKATENKRVYPYALWERELRRLGKQLEERKVYGELDHPMDGRTQLKRVSHIITKLWVENGIVMGEAEILNTAEGKNLQAILEANGKVGVSSRGFGTTKPNMKGEDVVQDDYKLMTFDFVAEPANVTSYPDIKSEGAQLHKETDMGANLVEDLQGVTLEMLKENAPALYEHFMDDAEREWDKKGAEIWAKKIEGMKKEAQTDLRAEFAGDLQQSLASVRADLTDEIREQMLADPAVAGAKAAMEAVKTILRPYLIPEDAEGIVKEKEAQISQLRNQVSEKELELANLREQNEKLANIAKEAGYRFHLEELLRENPQADKVRSLIGDVTQFENLPALDGRVIEICDALTEELAEEKVHRDEMEKLRNENLQLREAVSKSVEASQQLILERYTAERLQNHPNPLEVRTLIEQASPQTKDEIDTLLETVGRTALSAPAQNIDEARARVRNAVGNSGAREYLQEHAEQGNRGGNNNNGSTPGNWNGTGMALTEVKELAGMGPENN